MSLRIINFSSHRKTGERIAEIIYNACKDYEVRTEYFDKRGRSGTRTFTSDTVDIFGIEDDEFIDLIKKYINDSVNKKDGKNTKKRIKKVASSGV